MQLLYQNFDCLDVTFEGALPEGLLKELEAAKDAAQEGRNEVYLELGPNKLKVMVAEAGMAGGYRYRFHTGPDGEVWAIAHSTKLNKWNIRVSPRSLAFALYGYAGVKARILEKLALLGAQGVGGAPLERVSRVDYCFDFLTSTPFNPDPTLFVAHQHCKKQCHGEKEMVHAFTATQGDQVQTIMIGKMPGRQALLYNKSLEIQSSSKAYWADIWQLSQLPAGTVWRIEVRAGKNELDKWNLKRFADVEARVGDVIVSILKAMRYVTPNGDSNRSRWPTSAFWQEATESASKALAPYSCNADRGKIINDLRLAVVNRYKTNILGSTIALAAASECDPSEIESVSDDLRADLLQVAIYDKAHFLQKYEQGKNKFRLLT